MNKNKQIVIITGVFLPEPVVSATMLGDLALEFSKKYEVIILRPHPTRPYGFILHEFDMSSLPYKIIELKSYTHPKSSFIGRFRENMSMGFASIRYIKKHYKDISIIYNAPWPLFGRNMVAQTAKKYNIPYIVPVTDIYPESILSKLPTFQLEIIKWIVNKLFMHLEIFTLSHAVFVHTQSDTLKNYLSNTRNIESTQFKTIPWWQNEDSFIEYRKNNKIQNNGIFTFMYMGNIGPLAGIDLLIKAFVLINRSDIKLIIAGSGSEKENLQKLVEPFGKYNIQFTDVPSGKVPETQAQADIMLLPMKKGFSRTSIPSKLFAYMFSSKPVLACIDNDSDAAFYIKEANCGWVIEPENIDILSEYFERICTIDKRELQIIGENGFSYALENFSRKNNLKKLTELFDSILK